MIEISRKSEEFPTGTESPGSKLIRGRYFRSPINIDTDNKIIILLTYDRKTGNTRGRENP